jgi:putative FmdB family regulatory protein
MPRYDFQCRTCGHVRELQARVEERHAICEKCYCLMERQPAAPAFTVTGYNAKNGYSKTNG